MTREPDLTTRDTRDVMRETAASLEAAEAILHRSAEESPNRETTRRLHHLGDRVTAEAKQIAARASRLSPEDAGPDVDRPEIEVAAVRGADDA